MYFTEWGSGVGMAWQPLKQRWIIIRVFYKLTQKPVSFLRKGFNFLKCRFSFLLMLWLHKEQYFCKLARIASVAAIFCWKTQHRNNGSPISVCSPLWKFISWVNRYGSCKIIMGWTQRFLDCFLKILEKKRKNDENYSPTSNCHIVIHSKTIGKYILYVCE